MWNCGTAGGLSHELVFIPISTLEQGKGKSMPPGPTDGSTMHGQRCGKYKVSETSLEVPRGWKALFFCCVQLPAALLWVANALVNVVAIRVFWRSDSIFLCVAFGIGAAVNFLFAAGEALYLIVVDREGVEAWLGFHSKWLLIPPLTLLFPFFFPAWLWFYPYPRSIPDTYNVIEEEELDMKVMMAEEGSKGERFGDSAEMMNPIAGTIARREIADSMDVASDDLSGELPPFRGSRSPAFSGSEEFEFSSGHMQSPRSPHLLRLFDRLPPPTGDPPRTRRGEATTLPPGIVDYRAVAEIEDASRSSAYWHLLWDQYRSQVQRVVWAFDGHLNVWHLVAFASGALRAMKDPAFNDATYYVCVTGFLVKAAYMMFVLTARYCSRSLSRAYGVVGAALYAHDIFSNSFSLFLCGSFGLSIFNSLTPPPGDESKDLHSLGLNGFAAFKAIQAFVWITVGAAGIGFIITTVIFGIVAAARLKWTPSLGEKVCKVIGYIFFVVVVVPHQQLMRTLAPSLLYPRVELPRDAALDFGGFLRLFHFVTAHSDAAVRVKRMYFLLREELCDRIDASWRGEHSQELDFINSSGDAEERVTTTDNSGAEKDEVPVNPGITKLYEVLSTRPFSTRTVVDSYREETPPDWAMLDQVLSVAEKLNMVGGFIQFVFPLFFVPRASASWFMILLFVGKCVSLGVIVFLTPAAFSFTRFWREMSPLVDSLTPSTNLELEDASFVAFRWIARYFRTINVPALSAVPADLLPTDISERISGFVHPSQLVIPPEVDGDHFEEEYAADVYELPLWDGQVPKPIRGWTAGPSSRPQSISTS